MRGFAAVTAAVLGAGAFSIIYANLARSALRSAAVVASFSPRAWLWPCRLTWAKSRQILSYGLPIGVAAIAAFAAKYWDNLLVSAMFGPAQLGRYQLAYNLADVPATHVGEQMGDVLLPSFARLDPQRRGPALVRSLRLLALVMFPLGFGLAAVSPAVVTTFLDQRWQGVAPCLQILALLSTVAPFGYVLHVFFNATGRTKLVMGLGIARLALLLLCLVSFGALGGPIWVCAGPVAAFGVHALLAFAVAMRREGLSLAKAMRPFMGPFVASITMVVVVLLVRQAETALGLHLPALQLVVDVLAGTAAYLVAAFLFAGPLSREALELVRGVLRRRAGGPA